MTSFFSPVLFAEDTHLDWLDSAYVIGFLARAKLTNGVIINRLNTKGKIEGTTDYIARVLKTRLGDHQA